MRPKKCVVRNFCSYTHLEFDFSSVGLALVSGVTGSGKSTLADVVPWICWATTSKNGAADDVRAWGADEPTSGTLEVETATGTIEVTRVRGKQSQNDLYWTEETAPETKVRGKDLADTQKLLNARLGVDPDLFLIGAYFSQFSTAEEFFHAKAKDRRAILERISDLSTAVRLGNQASEARKVAKKELEALETEIARSQGRLDQLVAQKSGAERESECWEVQQARQIKETQEKSNGFETEKQKRFDEIVRKLEMLDAKIQSEEDFEKELAEIDQMKADLAKTRAQADEYKTAMTRLESEIGTLDRQINKLKGISDECPTCLRTGAAEHCKTEITRLEIERSQRQLSWMRKSARLEPLKAKLAAENDLALAETHTRQAQAENQRLLVAFERESSALEALDQSVNVHADRLEQLKSAVNPYTSQVNKTAQEIEKAQAALQASQKNAEMKRDRVTSLSQVYDLSYSLRGELLQNAVRELEQETNKALEDYFEGVFRVTYTLEDSDKLELSVMKDGHEVGFRCLSGGERRQLVLSFWKALAKRAADTAGVSFSIAMLDEAFNGLSDDLKIKAFRMLEDLSTERETVLVIEHSPAMQSMFNRVFTVEKQGDHSVITEGEIGNGSVEAA